MQSKEIRDGVVARVCVMPIRYLRGLYDVKESCVAVVFITTTNNPHHSVNIIKFIFFILFVVVTQGILGSLAMTCESSYVSREVTIIEFEGPVANDLVEAHSPFNSCEWKIVSGNYTLKG